MKKRNQQGFTLIELIMVIVILGILAAVALPKFFDISSDARKATVNGVGGAIKSAVVITKSAYLAAGDNTATSVNGVTVNASSGIPTGASAGIGTAIDLTDFTVDYTTPTAVTVRPSNAAATPASCQVSYNGTTGVVTITVTDCS